MKDQNLEQDILRDLWEQASAVGELSKDEKTFTAAYEAFRSQDPQAFHNVLDKTGLIPRCHLVCEWIRVKECIFLCFELCDLPKSIEKPNLRQLAEAIVRITSNEKSVRRIVEAVEQRDRKVFENIISEYKLEPLCHFFCHWICTVYYRLICHWMCGLVPERPSLVSELQSAGKALQQLLDHRNAFDQSVVASNAGNAEKLASILRNIDLFRNCYLVCEWFCSWRCTLVCLSYCRRFSIEASKNQIREAYQFATAIQPFARDLGELEKLSIAVRSGDAKTYDSVVAKLKLQRFCIQLCYWICTRRCRRFCILVCPPIFNNPWFTHVGDFGIYADISSTTGLTNKAQSSHGGPDYGFFNCLSLRGLCPKYHPSYPASPSTRMAYRFLYQPAGAAVPTPITGGFVCEVLVGSRYALWNGTSMLQTVRIRGTGTTSPTPPVGPAGPTPPDHFIVPDAQGWVQVDVSALDDGFDGWLMGFSSSVAFPGGYPAPGVLAGAPVPGLSQRNGADAAIIFQATRINTIPAVNGGAAPDFTNQLARIHINNWDEVNLLDLQQFLNPGMTACSPLSNDLDILYTVDHELLADWHFGLTTASGMTLTMPPSGPDVLHPRGNAGTFHQDISTWPMCSYALTLSTSRRLTDGLKDDLGKVNQKTFCIGKKRI
jgi:hypothetical protein